MTNSNSKTCTVLLGNPISDAPSNNDDDDNEQLLRATTAAELAAARAQVDNKSSSLETLKWVVNGEDLSNTSIFDPMSLAHWVDLLQKPNGQVQMEVCCTPPTADTGLAAEDLQPIHTAFLLAGLTSASEFRGSSKILLTAKFASTSNGNTTATAALSVPLKKTAFLDDADLIDEDILLEDDGLLPPPPAMSAAKTAGDDCDGRKACDNCTCGRADAEAAAETASEEKHVPSSSCGKCGMGDAFRCASCPYLGKPAFKPGEEHLVLDLADDL